MIGLCKHGPYNSRQKESGLEEDGPLQWHTDQLKREVINAGCRGTQCDNSTLKSPTVQKVSAASGSK